MNLFENFKKVNVLVIGDCMIDRYWRGNIKRISPEAPVPVVNLEQKEATAGGAANVAANIAGLGASPYLIGITGKDEESEIMPRILEKANVSGDFLVALPDRLTTVKTRIVAQQQHVVRLDQETVLPINEEQEKLVWRQIEKVFEKIDLAVISDYAKGFLTPNLLSRLISHCRENKKKVLVDPKGRNFLRYRGATLLTPNKREAAEACKLDEDCGDVVEISGQMLLSEIDVEALLITQGEDGMTLFEKNRATRKLKAVSREVFDVTGAGDTVIAVLAAALGAGADFLTAAEMANTAAGIVIEHFGTTIIKLEDLRKNVSKARGLKDKHFSNISQ